MPRKRHLAWRLTVLRTRSREARAGQRLLFRRKPQKQSRGLTRQRQTCRAPTTNIVQQDLLVFFRRHQYSGFEAKRNIVINCKFSKGREGCGSFWPMPRSGISLEVPQTNSRQGNLSLLFYTILGVQIVHSYKFCSRLLTKRSNDCIIKSQQSQGGYNGKR